MLYPHLYSFPDDHLARVITAPCLFDSNILERSHAKEYRGDSGLNLGPTLGT